MEKLADSICQQQELGVTEKQLVHKWGNFANGMSHTKKDERLGQLGNQNQNMLLVKHFVCASVYLLQLTDLLVTSPRLE